MKLSIISICTTRFIHLKLFCSPSLYNFGVSEEGLKILIEIHFNRTSQINIPLNETLLQPAINITNCFRVDIKALNKKLLPKIEYNNHLNKNQMILPLICSIGSIEVFYLKIRYSYRKGSCINLVDMLDFEKCNGIGKFKIIRYLEFRLNSFEDTRFNLNFHKLLQYFDFKTSTVVSFIGYPNFHFRQKNFIYDFLKMTDTKLYTMLINIYLYILLLLNLSVFLKIYFPVLQTYY